MSRRPRWISAFFVVSILASCSSPSSDDSDPTDDTPNPDGTPSSSLDAGGDPNSPDASQSSGPTDDGCGGANAPPCADGKKCLVGKDCESLSCQDGRCVAATSKDGIQNGDESDVDCGGSSTSAPPCDDGKTCLKPEDCTSLSCNGTCQAATSTDGVVNGTETDVDCGGGTAPACADGKKCSAGTDCTSLVCKDAVCQAPRGDDQVKNGDESDVDCGGTQTGAPRCNVGSACNMHGDCASDGCDYAGKCTVGRSCTRHLGGDTCGAGEIEDPAHQHESCCATAKLDGSAAKIDKYVVTAGRMRAFIERTNGDVRTFAKTTSGWKTAWDGLVPSTLDEADEMLGPYWTGAPNGSKNTNSKRSCGAGSFGGHTYWTGKGDAAAFTQDQLDPKALNCVGWHLMRAFCAWDGGRLATSAEIINAFRNNGTTTYPWSPNSPNGFGGGATEQNYRLNHGYSYGYPGAAPMNGGSISDVSWYVSPPGRFPAGANKNGVEVAGNVLQWSSNAEYQFVWTFSWEKHGKTNPDTGNWKTVAGSELNGYYAIGGRCVHD